MSRSFIFLNLTEILPKIAIMAHRCKINPYKTKGNKNLLNVHRTFCSFWHFLLSRHCAVHAKVKYCTQSDSGNSRSRNRYREFQKQCTWNDLGHPRIDSMIIILYFLQQRCIFNHTLLPKFYNRTQFRIDKCISRFIGNCLQTCSTKLEW